MAQFDSQEGKTISNVEAASETVPTIISTSATTSASLAGLLAGPSKPSDTKVPKGLSDELAEWFRKGSSSSEIKFILDLYPFLLESKAFNLTPPQLDDWMLLRLLSPKSFKTTEEAKKMWFSSQVKILYIAAPLIATHSQIMAHDDLIDHPVTQNIKSVLQLLQPLQT